MHAMYIYGNIKGALQSAKHLLLSSHVCLVQYKMLKKKKNQSMVMFVINSQSILYIFTCIQINPTIFLVHKYDNVAKLCYRL